MLQHEDQTPTAPPSAAERRVTPEELASAIARLEARRERETDGTIRIGDAVSELGLTASPEAVWTEVQAARAQGTATRKKPFSRRSRLALLGSAGLALIGLAWWQALPHTAETEAPPVVSITAPAPPQAAHIAIPHDLLVRQAAAHQSAGKIVLLSEVGDDQPVLCLLTGTDTGAKFANFAPANIHWTLIKHGGKVYVRGWIGDMSDTALRASTVEVHPAAYYVASGLRPVSVTLPVVGFLSSPGLTSDDMISATHVVPDEHFKEKRTPNK